MVFPEREQSSPGKKPWSRQNTRAIPPSSSKGTSTSETSGKNSGTNTLQLCSDASMSLINDTPNRPKLDIHTNGALDTSSKAEQIEQTPETATDDQVTDVMTIPGNV